MKQLLLIFVPIFILACASTPGNGTPITEPVTYSEIIEVSNATKGELHTKINMWFVDAFRNADSVIQFNDKESGIIKGKYTSVGIFVGSQAAGEYLTIYSTITVEIKDGRYKVSFADPSYRNTGNYFGGPNSYPTVYPERSVTTTDIASVVLDNWKKLANNLQRSISTVKSNDW